jgi:hypothetical protein
VDEKGVRFYLKSPLSLWERARVRADFTLISVSNISSS